MEIEANLTIEMDGSAATVCSSGRDLDVRFGNLKALVRCLLPLAAFRQRQAISAWLSGEGICCRFRVGERVLVEVGAKREPKGFRLGGKQWRIWPLRWALAARGTERD
jgi:hypothetical protein